MEQRYHFGCCGTVEDGITVLGGLQRWRQVERIWEMMKVKPMAFAGVLGMLCEGKETRCVLIYREFPQIT